MNRKGRLGLLSRRVALFVGSTFVTLVLGVVAVEILLDPPRQTDYPFFNVIHPYVMFRPAANDAWRSEVPTASSRFQKVAIAYTNEDGFRIPAPTAAPTKVKPKGHVRVAVVGGSTVHGGTEYDDTLPGALQAELDGRFPGGRVEVISAGIVSAISRQQLVFLVTTVLDYNIDVVVNYDGVNDSGQMLYYEKRVNYPYNYSVVESSWRRYVEASHGSIWDLIGTRSCLLARMFPDRFGIAYLVNNISGEAVLADPEVRETYAAAYIDNWDKIRRVCAGWDVAPFFVLQPTGLYSVDEAGALNALHSPALRANYMLYELFRIKVAQFARDHPDVEVADFADLLPAADFFYDGCHVYDGVNAEIASHVADLIGDEVSARLKEGER